MHRFASLLTLAAITATAAAQTIVIPNGYAAVEGASSNAFPWGRTGIGLIEQMVYDSTHFTAQGINFPILITGLKWRPNTNVALVASSYTAGCSVSLSTCPFDQAAVSTTMANNRGANFATVFSGPVSWGAQPAQVGPTPFGISVPFTTPFLYDPSLGGDLNIECDLPIQTFTGAGPQLDVVIAAPLASRTYISTGYPGTGIGVIGLNHGVVVEVTYVPASGLYAGFTANVTSGTSPLAVTFTNTSFSSDPGGITSWAWDFDGDAVIDSTLQNPPPFTYTTCGDFNVSLTVTDATFPASTLTRTAYIKTDNIVANFSYALLAPPNVFQFTDLTTPAATSWDWDFNGDNITDSTAQNPVTVLPQCQAANVRLIASRLCRTSTVTKTAFAAPNTLSTPFTANNGGASGWTVMFDANVTNPQGINICGMDHNTGTTVVGTPFTFNVYVTPGTYVGNDNNIAPWRLVGSGAGLCAGNNVPSTTALATPLYLPLGSFGIAINYVGCSPRYTNGPAGPYSNGDVTLTLGAVRSTLFNAGSLFTPRVWNGALHYDTIATGGSAGYGFFGPGCAGTLGITRLVNTTQPTIGGTLSVNLNNLPFALAVMVVGTSNTISGFGPLPFDLGIIGAPGCPLRVSLDATETVVGAGTTATWNFNIPNIGGLLGVQLYNQAATFDPAANAFGFVTSDASAWVVGL